MKKLNDLMPQVIDKACKHNNFIQHKIIVDWLNIVGDRLAEICIPMTTQFTYGKEVDGTLVIGVSNPSYVLELQMMEKIILQRLAVYFGYKAINKLRLKYIADKKNNTVK